MSSQADIFFISFLLLGLIFLFVIIFFVAWWVHRQRDSLCPYTGAPLRRAEQLSYYAKEQILRFLYEHNSYENKMFKLNRAGLCRETCRIFPNALTWYDTLYVDWTFLQKRHPGSYVSWGSLTLEQQESIRRLHGSLKGYQTVFSSRNPSPREVESDYVFAKPGPLYVDVETQTLLGWKLIPGTDYEVLIVQRPPKTILPESLTQSNTF